MQENQPTADERAEYETPRLERHDDWTIVTGSGPIGGFSFSGPIGSRP